VGELVLSNNAVVDGPSAVVDVADNVVADDEDVVSDVLVDDTAAGTCVVVSIILVSVGGRLVSSVVRVVPASVSLVVAVSAAVTVWVSVFVCKVSVVSTSEIHVVSVVDSPVGATVGDE
jgi:hypothetical protein